ncbi:MAG: ATP-binding cassette domain-containing protein [Oscillospiraceae bacterium]|nr:ATP-binding cassette domain-containing protein [Oscillospiraceae bacterium]
MLELRGVCKQFPGFLLNNISFSLPKGYIMGLVGPNGAGKTTTIQLILNMFTRDSGEILMFGQDNIQNEHAIKQAVGVVFDSSIYVDTWTVRDTEKAVSIFYDDWKHDVFVDMARRFTLPLRQKVRDLSRGMQMKLMLACAFSHGAKLLIFDEPTSGRSLIYGVLFASVMFSVRIVPLPFKVLNQNESSKNTYTMLPVPLNNIIIARYLSIFFVGSAGIIISTVIAQVASFFLLKASMNIGEIVIGIVVGCACVLILLTLQIPFIYKQGVIQGRTSAPIVIASIFLFVFGFGYRKLIQLSLDRLQFAVAFCMLAVLLSIVSISISIDIAKKEK